LAVVIGVFALSEVLVCASAPIRKVSELIDFCGVKLPSFAMWKGRIRNLRKSVLVGIVFAKALVV